jgi:hypothetical protein
MNLTDLVKSKDGSLSLTKLAASTAHFTMACGFVCLTVSQGFLPELWMIYGAFALGHAITDKSANMLKAYHERPVNN